MMLTYVFFFLRKQQKVKGNREHCFKLCGVFFGFVLIISKASYLIGVEMSTILQGFHFGLSEEEKCTLHR